MRHMFEFVVLTPSPTTLAGKSAPSGAQRLGKAATALLGLRAGRRSSLH